MKKPQLRNLQCHFYNGNIFENWLRWGPLLCGRVKTQTAVVQTEWIHSEKQLYARKVPSFPTFVVCHHKRQHFELLVPEIKCWYSTADLCAQIYANMLISSRCSLLTGQFARWRGHDKNYCVGEVWTVSKWSPFTHEMSHSVYNLPRKTTRQKPTRVPLVSVLKKMAKNKFGSSLCLP